MPVLYNIVQISPVYPKTIWLCLYITNGHDSQEMLKSQLELLPLGRYAVENEVAELSKCSLSELTLLQIDGIF